MPHAAGMTPETTAALAALARQQHGVFRLKQALELGVWEGDARTAVRRGDWVRLRHGTYALAATWLAAQSDGREWARLRCAAELISLGFQPVISHEWAARLHRMPHLGALGPRPVITRAPHRSRERSERSGLFVAALPPEDQTVVDGIPVTTPARTALDLARRDGRLAGVVAADAALAVGASRDDLAEVLARCWHWPGGATAREAVALARRGSQSALESLGRVALLDRGAPEPELQLEVRRWGELVARVDQGWRDLLLVVEADGAIKYTDEWRPQPLLTEKRRQERIEQCGLSVVRYDWAEAWHTPTLLMTRWSAAAATAAQRRLAPGVELRLASRDVAA